MAKVRIVKKRTKTFDRFESNRHIRIKRSWRRPRGIDCPVRRRFRGNLACPTIGFGSNNKTRHLLPNYKKKFLVNNPQELELLLMNNEQYCAEIGATVGTFKRIQILQRAKELRIRITNAKSSKIVKLEETKAKI